MGDRIKPGAGAAPGRIKQTLGMATDDQSRAAGGKGHRGQTDEEQARDRAGVAAKDNIPGS